MKTYTTPIWETVPLAAGNEPDDIPDLTVYTPDRPTGAAMVVFPGGGYRQKVAHEKEPVALWMVERGITAFILSYRVGVRNPHPAPWLDAAESIRLVRARAQEFGIDPRRIGVIGFSAGGHLAAHVATTFDTAQLDAVSGFRSLSSRPDLVILGYPVIDAGRQYALRGLSALLGDNPTPALLLELSPNKHVSEQTPPTFIVHSTLDDRVPVQHSLDYALALRDHGVPVELHLYERGNHGFGASPMAPKDPELATWLDHMEAWLRLRGYC